MIVHVDRTQPVRARHRVILKTAGQQLAACCVVNRVLAEHLAHALHHAAVNLPFDEHGIDHVADIIHCRISRDRRLTGRGIDLDFRDMAAVRIRRAEIARCDRVERMR